jgi:hypothetical protein
MHSQFKTYNDLKTLKIDFDRLTRDYDKLEVTNLQ